MTYDIPKSQLGIAFDTLLLQHIDLILTLFFSSDTLLDFLIPLRIPQEYHIVCTSSTQVTDDKLSCVHEPPGHLCACGGITWTIG